MDSIATGHQTKRARRWLPVLTQLAGVVAMAVGFGLLSTWAGVFVGGIGLVAIGTVAEIGQQQDLGH
jgi:hypothetical protein